MVHAAAELGLKAPTDAEVGQLMAAYDRLNTFPDVAPSLETIARHGDSVVPLVFSNGTRERVLAGMASAGLGGGDTAGDTSGPFTARDVVTVDDVQAFKPKRNVYEHLLRAVGKSQVDAGEVWLVTSNPFDIVGARAAGLQAAWVDRSGSGWKDRLGDLVGGLAPTVVANGAGTAVEAILKASGKL